MLNQELEARRSGCGGSNKGQYKNQSSLWIFQNILVLMFHVGVFHSRSVHQHNQNPYHNLPGNAGVVNWKYLEDFLQKQIVLARVVESLAGFSQQFSRCNNPSDYRQIHCTRVQTLICRLSGSSRDPRRSRRHYHNRLHIAQAA
jgi:hypothetical protein